MTARTYLVTGVSRGLGLVLARLLLSRGHAVYGLSRSESEGVGELRAAYPESFRFRGIDLGDTAGLEKAVFGEFLPGKTVLDGLANNAALAYDDLATNLRLDPLESMFRVNVHAPMVLSRGAIRNFLLHGTAGSLVHVSSVSVHTGYKGLSFYAATKGALEAYSRNLAREWGRRGVRSNCVAAGFMETAMTAGLEADTRERIHRRTALGRPTDPERVAEAVAFLLSSAAAGTTGETLRVDGGAI